MLTYSAWDLRGIDNRQTVATDRDGRCTLIEALRSGQQQQYYDNVRRQLTVDIPGYVVGPVPFGPKKGAVNTITAKKGASILGKFVDWNGNAVCDGGVQVEYRHENDCQTELFVNAAPDGSFAIERIMPGEPISLSGKGTLTAEARSETFTLMPGEVRKWGVLKAFQPVAVRGVLVDEEDTPVHGIAGCFSSTSTEEG